MRWGEKWCGVDGTDSTPRWGFGSSGGVWLFSIKPLVFSQTPQYKSSVSSRENLFYEKDLIRNLAILSRACEKSQARGFLNLLPPNTQPPALRRPAVWWESGGHTGRAHCWAQGWTGAWGDAGPLLPACFPMTWVSECPNLRASMVLGARDPELSGHVWTLYPNGTQGRIKKNLNLRARLQEAFSSMLAPRNHSDPFPCFPSPISHKTPTQCQLLAGGWGFRDKTYSLLSQIPQPSWRDGRI